MCYFETRLTLYDVPTIRFERSECVHDAQIYDTNVQNTPGYDSPAIRFQFSKHYDSIENVFERSAVKLLIYTFQNISVQN